MNESKMHLITEGTLTVVGKSWDGKEITVEADIRDLEITVERDYDRLDSIYGHALVQTRNKTTFSMDVPDKYTIKAPKTVREPVVHTARVLGWSDPEGAVQRKPSITLIREAALKAGVQEDTEFILVYEKDLASSSNKVYVEFKWTDN